MQNGGQKQILITRLSPEKAAELKTLVPDDWVSDSGGLDKARQKKPDGSKARLEEPDGFKTLQEEPDRPAPNACIRYYEQARIAMAGGMPEPDGI